MASIADPNSRMMTNALTMAPSVGTGGGGVDLMNQIPQVVATAVEPLIQNAGATISSNVASTLGADGGGMRPAVTPRPGGMPTKGGVISRLDQGPSNFSDPSHFNYVGPSPSILPNTIRGPVSAAMADGGSVPAAQAVQSQGRGNDSMLVHMTPNEVRGLQALAVANGGSLTMNPQTGLPEAGFLESILPMAVGFALGPAGFGLMGAGTAGLTVGGLTALATGDLGQGLMAGLGAYGGANLGSALQTAGANAEVAKQAAMEQGLFSSGQAPEVINAYAQSAADLGTAVAPDSLLSTAAGDTAQSLIQAGGKNYAMEGLKNLGSSGGWSNLGGALSDQFANAGTLGKVAQVGSALTTAAPLLEPEPMQFATPEGREWNYADPQAPTPRTYTQPSNADILRGGREYTYFTPSNPIPYAKGDSVKAWEEEMDVATDEYKDRKHMEKVRSNMNPFLRYIYDSTGLNLDVPATRNTKADGGTVHMEDGGFVMDARSVSEMGNGSSSAGLERLSQIGGMPIQGRGDGVSDSIPATIDGNPIAAVAREEAYFSPDAVRRIGGGSIQRGSDKLYEMMDKAIAARKKAGRGTDSGLGTLMA